MVDRKCNGSVSFTQIDSSFYRFLSVHIRIESHEEVIPPLERNLGQYNALTEIFVLSSLTINFNKMKMSVREVRGLFFFATSSYVRKMWVVPLISYLFPIPLILFLSSFHIYKQFENIRHVYQSVSRHFESMDTQSGTLGAIFYWARYLLRVTLFKT